MNAPERTEGMSLIFRKKFSASAATVDPAEAQRAFAALSASPRFAKSERLRSFLAYVIEEELAGRGETLRGKTIAQDVYGRGAEDAGDPENAVRVDARRLRSLLDEHYRHDGAADPVRVHLDPGGYRPRFSRVGPVHGLRRRLAGAASPAVALVAGVCIGVAASAALFGWAQAPSSIVAPGTEAEGDLEMRRTAIFAKSPVSMQAVNLAEQAREMLLPLFDVPRQRVLLTVFQEVTRLDPDYFGGHAGSAITLASLAVMTPEPGRRAELVAEARREIDQAVRLRADAPWTQYALSWVLTVEREHEAALKAASRAVGIDGKDPLAWETLAAVALFAGRPELALEAAERRHALGSAGPRIGTRNIAAAASFHVGEFKRTLALLDEAIAKGDPVSPLSLAYRAAALGASGRHAEARAVVAELDRAWRGFPIDHLFRGIYRRVSDAEAVVSELHAAGWASAAQSDRPLSP